MSGWKLSSRFDHGKSFETLPGGIHEMADGFVCDVPHSVLVFLHYPHQLVDADLLHITSHQLSARIVVADLLQAGIILQNVPQVLVRYVDIKIRPELLLQLSGLLATREGVLVDLLGDHLRCIRHEDGAWRRGAAAHFAVRTLHGREKLAMDASGLGLAHPGRDA